MRAICETCDQPQPPAWVAGDLCVHCGGAVRQDQRCFWCAHWTPPGKFCRHCGAETVGPRDYGAARMLKEAGTDRFTVPKMLRELDPEQIDNFTRIYQRHAVQVARHVDELRFLEQFLFQKTFSVALEEELIPQLPWNDADLARMSAGKPALPAGDNLPTVRAIEAASPLPQTRALATLARVRLEDWEAVRAARGFFSPGAGPENPLNLEAALVLSSWKIATAVGSLSERRELLKFLRLPAVAQAFPMETTVRIALLSDPRDPLPENLSEILTSRDPETAFAAALALGDLDRLAVGLQGSAIERAAAARRRIGLGAFGGLAEAFDRSDPDLKLEMLDALRLVKKPIPELADMLMDLYETTPHDRLRVRAAEILCRELNPAWALRICARAGTERYIFQALLSEKAALPPETLSTVCQHMIAQGSFRMSQYGMSEAAERGAVPDSFVPAHFADADEETQPELMRLAEEQLQARWDEALHRFVMNVVFGPYSAKTRAAAWWGLSRSYAREKYGSKGPFKLRVEEITRFFGSVAAFLPKFTAVLLDSPTMHEVGYYDFIADLLKYSDTDLPAAFAADPTLEPAGQALIDALFVAVRSDYWAILRTNAAEFIGEIGGLPAWRDRVVAELQRCLEIGSFDLKYACGRAVKTITGEPLN